MDIDWYVYCSWLDLSFLLVRIGGVLFVYRPGCVCVCVWMDGWMDGCYVVFFWESKKSFWLSYGTVGNK